MTRYQVPGRPTCLTVVGRRSLPTKVETAAEEMVAEPAEPVKEKKKKEKGKADRRTTSTSGNFVLYFSAFFVQFISNIKNGDLSSSQNLHHENDLGYFLSMRTYMI